MIKLIMMMKTILYANKFKGCETLCIRKCPFEQLFSDQINSVALSASQDLKWNSPYLIRVWVLGNIEHATFLHKPVVHKSLVFQ